MTSAQDPYETIEHAKITFESSLKVLQDYLLHNAYIMLNFDSDFLELSKLLQSILFKPKISCTFTDSYQMFNTDAEINNLGTEIIKFNIMLRGFLKLYFF